LSEASWIPKRLGGVFMAVGCTVVYLLIISRWIVVWKNVVADSVGVACHVIHLPHSTHISILPHWKSRAW
jgi:hypothetical protein